MSGAFGSDDTTHLRLYDYAASCNCYKVRLLLAQLGVSYERVPIDIFNGGTLTEDYGRINPMRTTPVLETADGRVPRTFLMIRLSSPRLCVG